ncbi:MAG: adenylate/guanylate cyclase domain-containing protein [Potamolinea sp.]
MLKIFRRRREALAQAVKTLAAYNINSSVIERFSKFLAEGDIRGLYRANPRMIADRLQLNERETLRLLVFALKEGLMTLNWEVLCPACSGLDFTPKGLIDLRTNHTCPNCYHVHDIDADDGVRLSFSIDQRLRPLSAKADDPNFRAKIDELYGVVSGHRLMTLQAFRDTFPRETIPPNESLLIRRVAILFTDLVGSTELYVRQGDSRAYSLVRQHFNCLFRVVDEHNGAVIKTIGDAIMVAFTMPADALQAAIAMHRQLKILNKQLVLSPEDELILKIGIDVGPCISVTLNERVDYFGTTVNTAARVQATSKGNDIAVTDALLQDETAVALAKNCSWQKSNLMLKGLDGSTLVHYLQPELILV